MESKIIMSSQELDYRLKHYHDIQIIKEREQKCCSCGNLISIATGKISSHFLLGTLQCLVCYNRIKEIAFANEEVVQKYCVSCGYNTTGYTCSNGNCRYSFCRKCIKRNASLALLNAETGQWKCFICEPKPLWELRGVCAAVMLPHLRQTKNAPTHSSYTKSRITKTKNVMRSLQGLCNDDNSQTDKDEDLIVTTGSSDSNDSEGACNAPISRSRSTTLKLNRSETSNKKLSKRREESKESESRQYAKHKITGNTIETRTPKVLNETSSDSDDEICIPKLKAVERTVNRGKAEKLKETNIDSESSSKEFQNLKKILHKTLKTDTKESKSGTSIPIEQSMYFKLKVVKILNRFKDLCSEYEIHMERFKVTHFRKEVSDVKTAEEIVQNASSVIQRITTSLQKQESKLNKFFITFKKELEMHKEDSDSEDTSIGDIEAGLEETEQINDTNERLIDDKQSDDASSLKKSKDKVELQNKCDILKTGKKKQKTIFLSTDSEEEDIEKQALKQDTCFEKKGTVKTDSAENSNLSIKKQKSEKQGEQLEASKDSNATQSNKDECECLEIDSGSSDYDVGEIFSDGEINSQQLSSKKKSVTENSKKKLAEQDKNDTPVDSKENPVRQDDQIGETDSAKDTNLNEIVETKKKDCVEKVDKENPEKINKILMFLRQENSDVLDESKEENDIVIQEVTQEENVLEESAKDTSEKQTTNAEETLLIDKNSTQHSETSDVSTRNEENILNKITDTEVNIGDTNLSTENPRSPILKCGKPHKLLAANEMSESFDDIFDSTSEQGESNVTLTKSTEHNKTTKDLIINDKDVSAENETNTGNISSVDKIKQGTNLQSKTTPTESAKKETMKVGTSEEPREKVKGKLDSEEERAKRMMLESEDSESEDGISVKDTSEKSSEDGKRKRKKSSIKIDSIKLKEGENEKGHSARNLLDNETFADQAEKTGGIEETKLKGTENSTKQMGEESTKKSIEKDETAESSKEPEKVSETPAEDRSNALKAGEANSDIASDTTEILILDSSYEHDKDENTALTPVGTIKKEPAENESTDESEEKAKKALLDSNSDDSIGTKDLRSELNKKRGKKILKNHSSNSDSSENETRVSPRYLRKRKVDRKESTSSRKKRRRYQFDVGRFQDPKLEMGCTVVIRRMSGELLEKYEKALKRSKLRLDRKAIKK